MIVTAIMYSTRLPLSGIPDAMIPIRGLVALSGGSAWLSGPTQSHGHVCFLPCGMVSSAAEGEVLEVAAKARQIRRVTLMPTTARLMTFLQHPAPDAACGQLFGQSI